TYRTKIMQRFMEQYYQETSFIPKIIYSQIKTENEKLVSQILKSRFKKTAALILPFKGKPAALIKLGAANAGEYLKTWLADKAGNLDKINQALEQLKQTLNLPAIPNRIECYDISNIQGTNPVGSMVVFVDGLPAKSQYRKFRIKTKQTPDDFAMMEEMLSRRLARIKDKGLGIATWPTPDLIVIDGGKGQLNAALSVLQATSLQALPIIGLAKRIEEIFLPHKDEPIILGHDQPALQLLQRLRDEAHRFGITFHRQLRSKQAVRSALDDIPGVGSKTKKLLKTKFGAVAEIKKTSFDDLSTVVGEKLAKLIQQNL
ncbi:MAG: helix-hairpin-helix domain-containing protein, partial [Patescibacteria group bacterium]